MYIYDFITSLEQLKKDKLPLQDNYPEQAIYYGYETKESIENRNIICDVDNQNYLVYSLGEQIDILYGMGIDQHLEYIQLLNDETFRISRASLIYLDAAIYEALRLYDEFSHIPVCDNPFFDVSFYGGVALIASFYDNNNYQGDASLSLLENIPIKRDILLAQFGYFMKRYIKKRLIMNKSKSSSSVQNYELVLKNTLRKYMEDQPGGYKISLATGFDNDEFDNFLQQIQNLPLSTLNII